MSVIKQKQKRSYKKHKHDLDEDGIKRRTASGRIRVSQEEIDEIYSRPYMAIRDVAIVLDTSRQYINDLVERGLLELHPKSTKHMRYFKTASVYRTVVRRKAKWLRRLESLRLPTTWDGHQVH